MANVETIYRETVRPLPVDDQKRLADIIMENVGHDSRSSKKRRSALDVLNSIRVNGIFRTTDEIDEYIRTERDSWDD